MRINFLFKLKSVLILIRNKCKNLMSTKCHENISKTIVIYMEIPYSCIVVTEKDIDFKTDFYHLYYF